MSHFQRPSQEATEVGMNCFMLCNITNISQTINTQLSGKVKLRPSGALSFGSENRTTPIAPHLVAIFTLR